MTGLAIAADLGGTKIASAVVDTAGRLVGEKLKLPTPARSGGQAVLDVLAEGIERQYALIQPARLAAIGVGTAGVVDEHGVIAAATDTMTDWVGTDLVNGLRARLPWAARLPIHVQNDVDAHAVGENWRGAGAGAASMLLLAVGTGIGAAFCVNGAVQRGAHRMAGEVGRMRVSFGDGFAEVTDDQQPAMFESNAAGPAILRCYRRMGGTGEAARGQDVLRLAKQGDQLASEAMAALGRRVGRVLGWLVLALDPAVVVLGGGVPSTTSVWWDALMDELRAGLPAELADLPVQRAAKRGSAALLGAALDGFRLAGVSTIASEEES